MLGNTRRSYGLVAIVLHWIIAPLFIGQLVLGFLMVRLDDQRRAFELIQLHKSLGFLILALAVPRLLWRLGGISPELPESMSRYERLAATLSHASLYGLMIGLPLTGWILVSVSTLGIVTFAFNFVVIPNLPLVPSDGAEAFWSSTHMALGFIAAAVVTLHLCAAAWHQFIRKDGLLSRILCPRRDDRGCPPR
ncbi:MAG: cytochrome b [Rhizobiaceae bacterium]|nr:cytochrome b [Rhizobiaceae bacterium]